MLLANTWYYVNSWLYREVGHGGVKKRFLDTFESLLNLQVLFLLVHPKPELGSTTVLLLYLRWLFRYLHLT